MFYHHLIPATIQKPDTKISGIQINPGFVCQVIWFTLYSGGLNTQYWSTKHIGNQIFWSVDLQWFGFGKVGHSNSSSYSQIKPLEIWVAILFGFPTVLDKMAANLFKAELYWKTEQRATLRIQNGIPALALFDVLKCFLFCFEH